MQLQVGRMKWKVFITGKQDDRPLKVEEVVQEKLRSWNRKEVGFQFEGHRSAASDLNSSCPDECPKERRTKAYGGTDAFWSISQILSHLRPTHLKLSIAIFNKASENKEFSIWQQIKVAEANWHPCSAWALNFSFLQALGWATDLQIPTLHRRKPLNTRQWGPLRWGSLFF